MTFAKGVTCRRLLDPCLGIRCSSSHRCQSQLHQLIDGLQQQNNTAAQRCSFLCETDRLTWTLEAEDGSSKHRNGLFSHKCKAARRLKDASGLEDRPRSELRCRYLLSFGNRNVQSLTENVRGSRRNANVCAPSPGLAGHETPWPGTQSSLLGLLPRRLQVARAACHSHVTRHVEPAMPEPMPSAIIPKARDVHCLCQRTAADQRLSRHEPRHRGLISSATWQLSKAPAVP